MTTLSFIFLIFYIADTAALFEKMKLELLQDNQSSIPKYRVSESDSKKAMKWQKCLSVSSNFKAKPASMLQLMDNNWCSQSMGNFF